MAFSDSAVSEYIALIEKIVWSKRRPPVALRGQVREGQRIEGQAIDLFLVRPMYLNPQKQIEQPVAKAVFVKSKNSWKVYWMKSDLKWHRYQLQPEVKSLEEFLELVAEDSHGCFWR